MLWLGVTFLVGNGEGQIKLINEQYFLVRKLGLGRGVVASQSSDHRGISRRWNEMVKTGGWFANVLKKGS